MAKLIPGKIRTEGIALCDSKKVEILDVKDSFLYTRVDQYNLRYSLDDDAVFCSCDFCFLWIFLSIECNLAL